MLALVPVAVSHEADVKVARLVVKRAPLPGMQKEQRYGKQGAAIRAR